MTIVVNTYSGTQSLEDATAELDSVISQIRSSYPQPGRFLQGLTTKCSAKQGTYVTYWISMELAEGQEPLKTRGRILIVPKNRKLYQIRYICPAEYNSDYENVFKKIRSTMTEL